MPDGFGGRLVLPRASCEDCQKITARVEGIVLRGMIWPLRRLMGISGTRRKIEEFIDVRLSDEFLNVTYKKMKPEDAGVIGVVPEFKHHPRLLSNETRPATVIVNWKIVTIRGNIIDRIGHVVRFDLDAFARFLAKIAHCHAVSVLGLDGFDAALPYFIRGKDPNWTNYVGCANGPFPVHIDGHGGFVLMQDGVDTGRLFCRMIMFRNLELATPVYDIFIGRLRDMTSMTRSVLLPQ